MILKPDGSEAHEATREGPASEAVALGQSAGIELKEKGGPAFFAPA
jgi:hydroxymethylbilane synthase